MGRSGHAAECGRVRVSRFGRQSVGVPKSPDGHLAECASHAVVAAVVDAQSQAEQTLAATLYPRLDEDWLLLADRGFYSFTAGNAAREGGTQLLWRVRADLRLPLVEALPDGSYTSVLIDPKIRGKARDAGRGGPRRSGTTCSLNQPHPDHHTRITRGTPSASSQRTAEASALHQDQNSRDFPER